VRSSLRCVALLLCGTSSVWAQTTIEVTAQTSSGAAIAGSPGTTASDSTPSAGQVAEVTPAHGDHRSPQAVGEPEVELPSRPASRQRPTRRTEWPSY